MALPVLTLRLFGVLEVHIGHIALPGLHLREGERLLAYLTLHHDVPIPYRQLAQRFWPSEARTNDDLTKGDYPSTRMAILSLRRALGEQSWRLVSISKGVLRFDLEGADADVAAFDRLVQQDGHEAWREALALYRGPLLDGWTEGWVQEARVRYRRSSERIRSALPPLTAPAIPEAAAQRKTQAQALLEADGGAVPLDSPFYIERATDAAFGQAIARRDSIVLVKGARQIGKTSLLARGLQQARERGESVLLMDFRSLSETTLASSDALYRALAQEMADQLDLDVDPEETWSTRRSANRNLERFLCDAVLRPEAPPLVWGLDEVDRLFDFPYCGEVFGLLRSWHNRRALDPAGPWSRLTMAMAYATEAHLFIRDINQSPFNVGTRLTLSDFTPEQAAELNRRYGNPLPDLHAVQRFYALLHGHPYLTRRGLSVMSARGLDIAALETHADRSEGVFGDHLRRLLTSLTHNVELTEIVRDMLRGRPCRSEEAFYRLSSAGVLVGETLEESQWRCPIYATYLRRHLNSPA